MNPFRKSSKISGQSVLEYSAIAMLVIVGILGMGPYVIRSVNSYFKTAEDQARDSFREEITQAPLDSTEEQYDLGTCEFSATAGCGDGTNCPKNQIVKKMGGDCEGRYNDVFQCAAEPNPGKFFLDKDGFPDCIEVKDYSGCPVGNSSQPPSILFKKDGTMYGYECCRDAKAAHPLRCGTIENGHPNQLLMVRECGPDMDNPVRQYFWEDSQHCDYSCGQLNPGETWCDPSLYNYDVPETLDGKVRYVSSGNCDAFTQDCADDECRSSNLKCAAECPYGKPAQNKDSDGIGDLCNCPSLPHEWIELENFVDSFDGTNVAHGSWEDVSAVKVELCSAGHRNHPGHGAVYELHAFDPSGTDLSTASGTSVSVDKLVEDDVDWYGNAQNTRDGNGSTGYGFTGEDYHGWTNGTFEVIHNFGRNHTISRIDCKNYRHVPDSGRSFGYLKIYKYYSPVNECEE